MTGYGEEPYGQTSYGGSTGTTGYGLEPYGATPYGGSAAATATPLVHFPTLPTQVPLPGWPTLKVELNTTADPNDPNAINRWSDITPWTRSATINRGRQDELADVQPGTLTLSLVNDDGRFNPYNTGSPYYPYLLPYRQIRVTADYGTNAITNPAFAGGSTAAVGTGRFGWLPGLGVTFTAVRQGSAAQWWANGTSYVGQLVGTSTTPTAGDVYSADGPAAAGQQWQCLAVAQPAVGQTVQAVTIYQNSLGTNIGYQYGTPASSPTGQMITVTTGVSTAPTGTARVRVFLSFSGISSSAYGYVAAAKAERAEPANNPTGIWDPGPATYPLFYGYEEAGWPQSYEMGGELPVLQVKCVDALSVLARVGTQDVILVESLVDNPLGLYSLNDGPGAASGRNSSGYDQPPLVPSALVGATATFGAMAALSTAPDGWTGLTFSFPAFTGTGSVPQISYNLTVVAPGTVSAATVELWLTVNSAMNDVLGFNIGPHSFTVNVTSSTVFVVCDGGAATATVSVNITDGLAHRVAVVVDATSMDLWVDDTVATTTGIGLSATGIQLFPSTVVPTLTAANMTINMLSIYGQRLTAGRLQDHYRAGTDQFRGDTAGERINRLLDYAAWLPTLRNIDTTSAGDQIWKLMALDDLGQSSSQQINSAYVIDPIRTTATSVLGNLDVDKAGNVRYTGRDYRYAQVSPVWAFGEQGALGELPYDLNQQGAFVVDTPPEYLYNVFAITQGTQKTTGVTIPDGDAESQDRFFPRELDRTINLVDPVACSDYTAALCAQYKDPHDRVRQVNFTPSSNPALWVMCLNIDYSMRILANRRPPNSDPISLDCFVEGTTQTINTSGTGEWTTEVRLSPVYVQNVWILGDPDYGVLGSTTVLVA